MKLFAFLLIAFLHFGYPLQAATLIPPKKPIAIDKNEGQLPSPPNSYIEDKINATQSFEKVLGQISARQTNNNFGAMVLPPPLPSQKQLYSDNSFAPQIQTTPMQITPSTQAMVVLGVPIPPKKPFSSKGNYVSANPNGNIKYLQTPEQTRLRYTTDNFDDRTASRRKQRDDSYERKNAVPSNNYSSQTYERNYNDISETNQKSPFKTGKLPRAEDLSTDDPVIVFFGEGNATLEVGQIDVMNNDILSRLKRNSSKRVAIYGFAENEVGSSEKVNQLSYDRAMVIGNFLSKNNIDHDRIGIQTMGSNTAISPKNRCDIIIY